MEFVCLVCIIEEKMQKRGDPHQIANRPAVTIAPTEFGPVTPICYEHLAFNPPSPLAVPNGTKFPPR
jgi:hypothetical protein